MQKKTFLGIFLLTSILYYVLPLTFLKFYNGTSDKAGFILILAYAFFSFTATLVISYFLERSIFVPILSIIFSLPIFFIFNSCGLVIIMLITIFSFFAYALTSLLK